MQNGTVEESTMVSIAASDTRHTGNAPAKKLGFGLVGSGKRTAVPSVFHEEEDDDAHKEKKMRPLVPIDYSTEELEAVQPTVPGAPSPNLAAAAEFAKRISNINPKEEKPDAERERSRRSNDKSSQRDRDRGDDNVNRTREENREKGLDRDRDREQGSDKLKTPDNNKLLTLKQLIDMIPKTKEELFAYEINWVIYDKVCNLTQATLQYTNNLNCGTFGIRNYMLDLQILGFRVFLLGRKGPYSLCNRIEILSLMASEPVQW